MTIRGSLEKSRGYNTRCLLFCRRLSGRGGCISRSQCGGQSLSKAWASVQVY